MASSDEISAWLAKSGSKETRKQSGSGGGGGFLGDLGKNLGGVGDVLSSVLPGLVDFGNSLGKDIGTFTRMPATISSGLLDKVGISPTSTLGKLQAASLQAGVGSNPGMAAAEAGDKVKGGEGDFHSANQQLLTNDPNKSFLGNFQQHFGEGFPTMAHQAGSFERTGGRIVGTARSLAALPASEILHNQDLAHTIAPNQSGYWQAWKSGQLAPTLIEDAANVAAAGEGLGGAVGRVGGLATAGEGRAAGLAAAEANDAARAGALANDVRPAPPGAAPVVDASLPAPPVIGPVESGAMRTALEDRLAGHAGSLQNVQGAIISGTDFANRIAGLPGEAMTLPFKGLTHLPGIDAWWQNRLGTIAERGNILAGRSKLHSEMQPFAEQVAKVDEAVPAHEQQAALRMQAGLLDPQTVEALNSYAHSPVNEGGVLRTPTFDEIQARLPEGLAPETLQAASEHYAGNNPELSARLGQVQDVYSPLAEHMQEKYIAGEGLPRPAEGTPERAQFQAQREATTGDQPIQSLLEKDIAQGKFPNAKQWQDEAAAGDPAAQAKLDTFMEEELAQNPDYYPPDLRSVAQQKVGLKKDMRVQADEIGKVNPAAGQAMHDLANDIGTGLDDVIAAHAGPQDHVIFGERNPEGTVNPSPQKLSLTKQGAERKRTTADGDFTLGGQMEQALYRRGQQIQNETILNSVQQLGQPVTEFTTGAEVLEHARANKLVAMNPAKPQEHLTADTIKFVDDADGPATVMVPKSLASAIKDTTTSTFKHGEDTKGAQILRGYDKGLQTWKAFALPLSPKWNVGNLVGNTLMAATAVGPFDAIKYGKAAVDLIRHPETDLTGATVLRRAGLDVDRSIAAETMAGVEKGGKLSKVADKVSNNKVTNTMYNANQWVDDFTHAVIYEAKKGHAAEAVAQAEELHKMGRMTADQVEKIRTTRPTDEAIVQSALKTAGDFSNLSHFEQQTVRRLVPFYPWYKHITKLVLSLPTENPYRTAWLLHLSDEFNPNKGQDLPDWLKAAVPGSEGFLRQSWNPLPGGGPGDSPLFSVGGMLSSLTPAAQVPITIGTGYNVGRGRMFTQAPGYGPHDSTGKPTSGFIGFPAAANYLLDQIPQTRMLKDMLQKPVVRFDSGQPMLQSGHTIPLTASSPLKGLGAGLLPGPLSGGLQGGIGPLGTFLTGATIDNPKIAESNARDKKRLATNAKAKKKYDLQVAKAK